MSCQTRPSALPRPSRALYVLVGRRSGRERNQGHPPSGRPAAGVGLARDQIQHGIKISFRATDLPRERALRRTRSRRPGDRERDRHRGHGPGGLEHSTNNRNPSARSAQFWGDLGPGVGRTFVSAVFMGRRALRRRSVGDRQTRGRGSSVCACRSS